jgi:hypothetical protein
MRTLTLTLTVRLETRSARVQTIPDERVVGQSFSSVRVALNQSLLCDLKSSHCIFEDKLPWFSIRSFVERDDGLVTFLVYFCPLVGAKKDLGDEFLPVWWTRDIHPESFWQKCVHHLVAQRAGEDLPRPSGNILHPDVLFPYLLSLLNPAQQTAPIRQAAASVPSRRSKPERDGGAPEKMACTA